MKKRVLPIALAFTMLVTQIFPLTVLAQVPLLFENSSIAEAAGTVEERVETILPNESLSESGTEQTQEEVSASNSLSKENSLIPKDTKGQEENLASSADFVEKSFTITLHPMGGLTDVATVQTDEDGFLQELPSAEKEYFSFLGWAQQEVTFPVDYTNEDVASVSLVSKETQFTEDTTIYAVWALNAIMQPRLLGEVWDGTKAVEPSQIDGVYQVGSPEELAWFRDTVNTGSNQISAVLTGDIDLNNMEWVPIGGGNGLATTCFNGSFDGAGYSITGVSINATFNFAGLFGYINDPAALVQNLSVRGCITSTSNNVGGIVGALAKGTVQNCSFEGSVTNTKSSSGYAGGIVGYFNNSSSANNPTVRGCVNKGAITGPWAGGIAGYGKFGTILECYNIGAVSGKTRAGGIAGQMQNNFISGNCYSTGVLSGSSTKGEITDFLYSTATLNRCGYAVTLYGAGAGTATDCAIFTTPEELLSTVGNAFVADTKNINNGYPILAWQGGAAGGGEAVVNPAVSLQGATTIFVEKGVSPNATTVTLALQDINEESVSAIEWKTVLVKGSLPLEDIVSISSPENNRFSLILSAIKGGGVIQVQVAVTVGEEIYTDTIDISVVPQITYASVINADATHGVYPVLGERATVQIYTLGGVLYDFANYPELNFKWRYNSPNATDIAGVTGKDYLIPGDGSFEAGNYVYVEILSGAKILRSAMDTRGFLAAEAYVNPDIEYIDDASSIFGEWYGPLQPMYGRDTNIIDMVQADLETEGFADVAVSIKSIEEIYSGGSLQQDGTIEYFYADPNVQRGLWMAQYKVTLTLRKGDVSKDIEHLVVNIPWDEAKVKAAMKTEILTGVTENSLLGNNDKDNITADLQLPKVIDGKKWAQIEWTSSDPTVVFVSNEKQNTANTLFEPYVGKVNRGKEAKIVTLTARFNFQFAATSQSNIVLYKTFTFKVPPLSGAEVDLLRKELLGKIDAGVASAGFSDYVTKQQLVEAEGVYTVYNDIQYPTTRNFGVDGKYFPVTFSSSNNTVIEAPMVANAARSFVYRPLAGSSAKQVNITITITDAAKGISASRTYKFRVEPLTQAELDSALALMTLVKKKYFEGLNNTAYADYYSITGKLNAFQEATWGGVENNDSIQWIYTNSARTNAGIIADEINGWEDQEAWRAFRSSDPTILDHETLTFSKPSEDTFVQISSSLTHAVLGKYWTKFEGENGYEVFESLYRQPVCEYVMVEGVNHVTRTPEELEKLRAKAIAEISAPISATLVLADFRTTAQPVTYSPRTAVSTKASGHLLNITVSNLEAGTTVFGLFRKVMEEQNYTYSAVGSYVRSITDANGNTLAERDGGPNSGWVYTVNGKMPLVYMNGYTLKQGDVVEIKYTTDYTAEQGAVLPGKPTKPIIPNNPTTPTSPNNPASSPRSESPISSSSIKGDESNSKGNQSDSGSTSGKAPTSKVFSSTSTSDLTTSSHADASVSTTINSRISASNGFDNAYVEEAIAENGNSHNPIMTIALIVGIIAFLGISGIIYTVFIKKKGG